MFGNTWHLNIFWLLGTYTIEKITPQATGESSKVKVKVRINIHGVFTVGAASLVEKVETVEEPEPEKKDAKDSKAKVQKNKILFILISEKNVVLNDFHILVC